MSRRDVQDSQCASPAEVVRWRGYPSWSQFAWLYLFSLGAGVRGLVGLSQEASVAVTWLAGAAVLLACAALLRRWAEYVVTSHRVAIRNGYSGATIDELALDRIEAVRVAEGPIARFFGIGSVIVRGPGGDSTLALRGVEDAEAVRARIEALLRSRAADGEEGASSKGGR